MKVFWVYCFISLCTIFGVHSQCLDSLPNTPDTVCLGENILFGIPDFVTGEVLWDFDSENTFAELELDTIHSQTISANFGIDVVYDSIIGWISFATDEGSNTIYVMEFGNGLHEPATASYPLDVPNNTFGKPASIDVLSYRGEWYGFVLCRNPARVIQLNFGTSLGNTPVFHQILGNDFTGGNSNMCATVVNDSTFVFVNDFNNNTTRTYFSTSFNTPTLEFAHEYQITESVGLRNMRVFKKCDKLYGIAVSSGSRNFHILNFGSSYNNAPEINSYNDVLVNRPSQLDIIEEGINTYMVYCSVEGRFYTVDLGFNLDTISPILISYGLPQQGGLFSLSTVYDNGNWSMFSYLSNMLFLNFNETDSLSLGNSSLDTNEVSYFTPGSYLVTLKYTDSSNIIQLLSKNIVVKNDTSSTFELVSGLNYCVDSATTFQVNLVDGDPAVSYTWTIGESEFVGDQDTSVVFDSGGTYEIEVHMTNSNNCNSTVSDIVELYNPPIASFSLDDTIVCANSAIPFLNTSINQADSLTIWHWDFGEGNESGESNPVHQFITADTFMVVLTASLSACSTTFDSLIVVKDAPEIVVNVNDACAQDTVQFLNGTDTSTLNSYYWNFGDGTTSDSLTPIHSYDSAGNYTVSFIANAKNTCDLVYLVPIEIFALPEAQFSYADSCELIPVLFQDESLVVNDSLISWNWTMTSTEGVDTSSEQNPTFTFNADTLLVAHLEVMSSKGCVDVILDSFQINARPQVNFNAELGCNNDSIVLINTSIISSGPFSTIWTLDNDTSHSQEPSFTYTGQDSVYVSLSLTDVNACADSLGRWELIDKQFVIDFRIPDTVCINERIIIQNNNQNFEHYMWNISDNDFINNGVIQNYSSPLGYKTVRGITSYQDPNTGVIHALIADQNSNEIAWLSFDDGLYNEPVFQGVLTNTMLSSPDDLELMIINGEIICLATSSSSSNLLLLRFGDQMNLNPQIEVIAFDLTNINTSLSFFQDGDSLYAFQTDFLSDVINRIQLNTTTYQVQSLDSILIPDVGARGMVAIEHCGNIFAYGINSNTRELYKFVFGSSISSTPEISVIGQLTVVPSDMEILKNGDTYYLLITSVTGRYYKIGLGDDLRYDSFMIMEETNFDQQLGTTLALDLGFAGSDYALFLYSNDKEILHSINYSNAAGGEYHISMETTPQDLKLTSPGWHQVSLLTETGQRVYKTIDSIYVRSDSSSLLEIVFDSNRCLSNPTQFSFLSLTNETIVSSSWTIDGVSTSSSEAFEYQFDSSASYDVVLTVTNELNCSNTFDSSYIIYPEPLAQIELPVAPYCTFEELHFQNGSQQVVDSVVNWNWDVNNQFDSSSFDLSYAFDSSGVKEIILSAQIPGCVNYDTVTVQIEEGSELSFDFDNHCQNDTIFFFDQTVGSGIVTYSWLVDTVSIIGDSIAAHIFDSSGTFSVTLVVTNDVGCQNSLTKPVVIFPVPSVDFEASISCTDWTTDFIDRSTLEQGNFNSWSWSLDNLQPFSTERNPALHITEPGSHMVQLKVSSDQNCVDSISESINTFISPTANFSTVPVCFGESNSFIDESTDDQFDIVGWQWQIENQLYTNSSPLHIFTSIDTFEVSLIVTNDNGCRGDTSRLVIIPEPPIVNFTTELVCEDDSVSFIDNSSSSSDSIVDFQWIIEGFSLMQGDTVIVVFEEPGIYQVLYQVSTQAGCVESIIRNITVNSSPELQFELPLSFAEAPYQLVVSPDQAYDRVNWYINEMLISTEFELDTTITGNGSYDIGLEVFSENGCSNLLYQPLFIGDITFDLELSDLQRIVSNNQVTIRADITNNSLLPVDSFNMELTIDGSTTLKQLIHQPIDVGNTLNDFQLPFTLGNEAIDNYICLFISLNEQIYHDVNLNNNSACLYPESFTINEVVPNPAQGLVYVSGFLAANESCFIELTNTEGKLFLDIKVEQEEAGFFKEEVELNNLMPGVYLLKITSTDKQVVHKIVKN